MRIHISRLAFATFVTLTIGIFFMIIALPNQVEALSGDSFKAGRIIDDAIFYDGTAMSASQIKSFLNAKVPVCDTQGEKMYTSTLTRAQWAAANGKPQPPYKCLRDYSQNTPTMESASGLCAGITGGSKSSARIIYDVAKACGINPQVLLVLLQKEQSLITDDWPWPVQYQKATGFSCPDTAPCDPAYAGFFYQVYYAARQFKVYKKFPENYNYRAYRNNNILWNPNVSCGSSTVYIENQATAGLYVYTPYRPNKAALDNLYGTGNSCSSYGNRNFWRMFNDWFGSTTSSVGIRLISCSGENYLVERYHPHKRLISNEAMVAWELDDKYFLEEDKGCNYPTYPEPLGRLVKSRDSGRVYLVDEGNGYRVNSSDAESAWGLGNTSAMALPQLDAKNLVYNLNLYGKLPRLAKSTNSSVKNIYFISGGNRHTIAGTPEQETESLRLIRGYDSSPVPIVSVSLLQTLTASLPIDYSFKTPDNTWYLLDHDKLKKVSKSYENRWVNLLTGPTLNTDALSQFSEILLVTKGFQRAGLYYHLTTQGALQRTDSTTIAGEYWGVMKQPGVTNLLKDKIVAVTPPSTLDVNDGNVRFIQCSGQKYTVERGIAKKRLITNNALDYWNLETSYFNNNDKGCSYPAYALSLDRLIRSRKTNNVYYVHDGSAYLVHSEAAEDEYGLGETENQSYPFYNPKSIHDNLDVKKQLPSGL